MGNFYNMMNYGGYSGYNGGLGSLIFAPFVLIVVIWTLYWKYQALWYAAKHDHRWWFIALLVINTLGILEILYLYVFSKKMPGHDEKNMPMVPTSQS